MDKDFITLQGCLAILAIGLTGLIIATVILL